MQTFSAKNLNKYMNGKSANVGLADGNAATTATVWLPYTDIDFQNVPEVLRLRDSEGNRSEHTHSVLGNRSFTFRISGSCEVEKVGYLLYYSMGLSTSAQDGSTGAYEHVFSAQNEPILPKFTLFFNIDPEDNSADHCGYKRMKGCNINTISFSVSDQEVTYQIEGMALEEDSQASTQASVSSITITDIAYQSNGLTRYEMGTTNLSTVTNGDILVVTSTGVSNPENVGNFIIVNVSDASDYVDVINPARVDASDDETGLTATGKSVVVVDAPTYAEPTAILLKKHLSVKRAANTAGLSAATAENVRNFSFSMNNNLREIREKAQDDKPLALFVGDINVSCAFSQIGTIDTGDKAITNRTGNGNQEAYALILEDTAVDLGTASTYNAKMEIILNEVLALANRTNLGSADEFMYDWTLNTSEEQALQIKLRNETASYGS